MIGDALMDSLGGALGGSSGAGTLPPPRAKVSRGGGAPSAGGFGAELVALVQEHCFHHLEAPIERVTGWDTPYPHAQEWAYFPGPSRVGAALKRVMEV